MELQILDYAIVAAGAFFALVGLFRGFSGEVGSASGWIAGAAAAYFSWNEASIALPEKWMAIAVSAVISVFSFWIIRVVVSKLINKALSQPTDALVGCTLGLVKISAIVILLMHFGIGMDSSAILAAADRFLR